MSSLGFRERILEVAEDGPALANSTVATSLLPTARKVAALPLGYFDRIGRVLAFDFSGRISTLATTPGSLTLELRLGGIAIFSSGAMALNASAQSNVHWSLKGELVARAIGSGSGTTFMPKSCSFRSHAVIGSPAPTAGGAGEHMLPFNAAPAVGTGVDNGAAGLLDLFATWQTANAANSIQLHCGSIDVFSGG